MNGTSKNRDTKKKHGLGDDSKVMTSPKPKRRKLCSMGTGEIVHIISYKTLPGMLEAFEETVQTIGTDRFFFFVVRSI